MAVTPVAFHCFWKDLGLAKHNFSSHTIKAFLTNTAPTASTDNEVADLTQISDAGGYTSAGFAVTVTSWDQTSGVAKLVLADTTLTATGAAIGPWRYVVLANTTTSGSPLICYLDKGASVTTGDGDPIILDFDGSNGALQLGTGTIT